MEVLFLFNYLCNFWLSPKDFKWKDDGGKSRRNVVLDGNGTQGIEALVEGVGNVKMFLPLFHYLKIF